VQLNTSKQLVFGQICNEKGQHNIDY